MSKAKPISQREARELKRRVIELEFEENNRRNAWVSGYPGGVHIGSMIASETNTTAVRTARKLGHAVVVTNNGGELAIYALPLSTGATP